MELISITINNRQAFVRPQSTVLQACEAAGVDVPRFCYHEKLPVAGNCRRCLVEIQKSPKPVVSCARPVAKGRVVHTDTPLVRKAREAVLEFLLINHPLDCPICDQGGECDLQDEAVTYGSDRGRFFEFKRSVEDKECGPIVKTIRTRCIHCTRCIRFSTEVAGNEVMGAFGRGEDTEIGTYIHTFLRTELSGNLVDLCPVGALTSKPYAYQARSWELQRVDTLDFFDALCSDISVHTRKRTVPQRIASQMRLVSLEEIVRILPRTNGFYSENWISDRTRYAFDGLKNARLRQPATSEISGQFQGQSWSEVLSRLSYLLIPSNSSVFSFIVGSQIDLESAYAVNSFAKRLGFKSVQQGLSPAVLNVDLPSLFSFNTTVQSLSDKPLGGLIVINSNLRYEASLVNTILRREQNRRAIPYSTIGAYQSLRYTHNHGGNSLRTLIAIIENRLPLLKHRVSSVNGSTGVFVSVEALRSVYAPFTQGYANILGKLLYTKTQAGDRLGFVHSSVGSLAAAYLGFSSNGDVDNSSRMTFGLPQTTKSFFKRYVQTGFRRIFSISFDTHLTPFGGINGNSGVAARHLPTTSLYERTGHFRTVENRRRKHFKVVTPPTNSRNIETVLSVLARKQGTFQWFSWTGALSRFNEEIPSVALLNVSPDMFRINPFKVELPAVRAAKVAPFHQTVRDFYLQEPIAANSPVRGECALFLNSETNFIRER